MNKKEKPLRYGNTIGAKLYSFYTYKYYKRSMAEKQGKITGSKPVLPLDKSINYPTDIEKKG